jgi:hypothetical protein
MLHKILKYIDLQFETNLFPQIVEELCRCAKIPINITVPMIVLIIQQHCEKRFLIYNIRGTLTRPFGAATRVDEHW